MYNINLYFLLFITENLTVYKINERRNDVYWACEQHFHVYDQADWFLMWTLQFSRGVFLIVFPIIFQAKRLAQTSGSRIYLQKNERFFL